MPSLANAQHHNPSPATVLEWLQPVEVAVAVALGENPPSVAEAVALEEEDLSVEEAVDFV